MRTIKKYFSSSSLRKGNYCQSCSDKVVSTPVVCSKCIESLLEDKKRLDWIDQQTDLEGWTIRQGSAVRGFRLQDTKRKNSCKTVREAIDKARNG